MCQGMCWIGRWIGLTHRDASNYKSSPPSSVFTMFLLQYEDQLISPKQFVHMSGKATLKDWKRAIRMGGVMLR